MEKYRDKILANIDNLVHNMEQEMMDSFVKVDKNGDGKITKVEAGPDIASIMDARKRTLERISDSEKK
jgi:hypothetical protein